MSCNHETYSLNSETWRCRCSSCSLEWTLTPAEIALQKISAQAVCVNMDGENGNEKMLKNVYTISEEALTAEHDRLRGAGAWH